MLHWPGLQLQPINLWSLPNVGKIMENWEQDAEAFYMMSEKANKRGTEAQEEAFCEKVSIYMADMGLQLKQARIRAFVEVMKM